MAATHGCHPLTIVSHTLRIVHAHLKHHNPIGNAIAHMDIDFCACVHVWPLVGSKLVQLLQFLPIRPPLVWAYGTLLYNDHGFTVSKAKPCSFLSAAQIYIPRAHTFSENENAHILSRKLLRGPIDPDFVYVVF